LFLAQITLWDMVSQAKPLPLAVMIVLLLTSLLSWTVIISKWGVFRTAVRNNSGFLRAFRKSDRLQNVAQAIETFPLSPLVSVFEFGYEEVDRQLKVKGVLRNTDSVSRALQLGISEQLARLERNMNWLATTATVSPFIGLLGTVWGIIDAFSGLGMAGSASLRAVAPGISEALITTALGLAAAIPAAVAYNYFTHILREMGSRMEDFSLEFLNVAERNHGG
jgi:biopolymer transport protein TolQ